MAAQSSIEAVMRSRPGRTTHAAILAGNLFAVESAEYGPRDSWQFPAAETPAEAVACVNWQWPTYSPWFPDGTVFEVRRVIDAKIGCTYVDVVCTRFVFEHGQMKEVF